MRTVVVDLGCADHGVAASLEALAEEYEPDYIYGFDPSPQLDTERRTVGDVAVTLRREAAWTHDGTIGYRTNGWGSQVGEGLEHDVSCFNFSRWLRRVKADRIIVKMDIEGAEVQVLKKMMADGTDALVDELLVEWHGTGEELETQLRCRVRRWWM